jgi:hypothetical protein
MAGMGRDVEAEAGALGASAQPVAQLKRAAQMRQEPGERLLVRRLEGPRLFRAVNPDGQGAGLAHRHHAAHDVEQAQALVEIGVDLALPECLIGQEFRSAQRLTRPGVAALLCGFDEARDPDILAVIVLRIVPDGALGHGRGVQQFERTLAGVMHPKGRGLAIHQALHALDQVRPARLTQGRVIGQARETEQMFCIHGRASYMARIGAQESLAEQAAGKVARSDLLRSDPIHSMRIMICCPHIISFDDVCRTQSHEDYPATPQSSDATRADGMAGAWRISACLLRF